MSIYILDFEIPLREIEDKIDAMKSTGIKTGMDVSEGVEKLENQLSQEKQKIYANLNRWERVQLARHPKRPYSSDYISRITDYWFELHGDRYYADDPAMICGLAIIENLNLMIIGQEKGRGTKSKVHRNFGMSPQKVRRVLGMVRGKRVDLALAALQYVPSPTATAVSKVIRSAVANAENNRFMMPESLKVVAAYADDAARLKRFRPQSRGRISPIIRRSCHITIVVDQEG